MSAALTPRVRVIVDNDFAGDPDDLFALAHQLLCGSAEVPFVIGSHLRAGDPFDPSTTQADNAVTRARELISLMGMSEQVPVIAGSNVGLSAPVKPIRSPGCEAIIAEALREDTDLPLFVTVGGGMTELASALMLEPKIASRLTAVWIGGIEHPGHAQTPPGADGLEYNLAIDPLAAQFVFNDSTVPLWQVPRDAYRQCLISRAELEGRVRPAGPLGAYLADALDRVFELAGSHGLNLGETYSLGDTPLVALTSLTSPFEPDPSSSAYELIETPRMLADGSYEPRPGGRPMRLYTRLDTRLMFEDMFWKFTSFAAQ